MSSNTNTPTPSNEALEFLLSKAITLPRIINIALTDGLKKTLANNIYAQVNVPEFDNSAMDGYAVSKPSDIVPNTYIISDRITAGSCGKPLIQGECARIFTGAPIPPNTFAVIAQEDSVVNKDNHNIIEIHKTIEPKENIRPKANDINKGDTILPKGRCLTPADIALISSIGVSNISVYEPLTIGVFFSGDELLSPEETLIPGKIYNSNQYSLIAMLQQLGANIINLGIIKDNLNVTITSLQSLKKQCDVIITTGGVSVGEEDHLRNAVSQIGSIDLWNVKMKPGKPLAYGTINHQNTIKHFIGLPGNPVSAIATFSLFIKPFLKKLMGMSKYHNICYPVQIDYPWSSQFRKDFVRVKINYDTIPPTVSKYKKQGSDVLMSTSWADGFAEMTDETSFKIGDIVNFYPLWN